MDATFKINDIVRLVNTPHIISRVEIVNDANNLVLLENEILIDHDLIKLWEPEEGEWCWFWDDSSDFPDLRKFFKLHTFKNHVRQYLTLNGEYYTHCEPFWGDLPTKLSKI